MQKANFLDKVASLYRCGNRSDHDEKLNNAPDETWTKPEMAGKACCALLDEMLQAMIKCNALTSEDVQEMYDNL